MDPETQRMFTVALIGLLLFFPVFNQVAQTAVDALTDADHRAQLDDFFKDWDHIPDDRKLEYWDGRNIPEGHWDGMDRDDDFRHRDPDNGPPGGPNGENENGNGEEENETEQEVEMVYHEEVLWRFSHEGPSDTGNDPLQQRDYHWVNVTENYNGFTGQADFRLEIGGSDEWTLNEGSNTMPALFAGNQDTTEIPEVGNVPMMIHYDYQPTGDPLAFEIVIVGTYLVPSETTESSET